MVVNKSIWHLLGGKEEEKSLCTTSRQLRVTEPKTGKSDVYAPVLYQSCMRPEKITIYDLKITRESDCLWKIETHYETKIIDIIGKDMDVSEWKGEIHKPDCRKCENCGRCSW